MPRPCSTCEHPQASAISKQLLGGASIRGVAGRFTLTPAAIGRHLRGCLRTVRRAERAASPGAPAVRPDSSRFDTLDPTTLIAATARLVDEALDLLEHAKRADDRRTALVALREARDGLALLMKTAGMLAGDAGSTTVIDQRRQVINVLSKFTEEELRALASGKPASEIETPFRDQNALTAT